MNEKVFDGDMYDDFAPGMQTRYVIDPAEGAPNHRMHLGDIRRLTLALHITGALPEGDWKPKRIWVEVNGIPVHHETIDKHLSVTVIDGEDAWTASWPRAAA